MRLIRLPLFIIIIVSVCIVMNMLGSSFITMVTNWRRPPPIFSDPYFTNPSFFVDVIIVDADLLRSASNQTLIIDRNILIAVDEEHRGKPISQDDTKFDVVYYSSATTAKNRDYWMFTMPDGTRRALLPFALASSSPHIFFPADIPTFLLDWQHSRFMECNVVLKRTEAELAKRVIPLSFLSHMAELRDFIKKRKARVLLGSGTLLGWYRECSIIPHTTDVDFYIRAEEYNSAIKKDLDQRRSPYKLFRIYGKIDDSYEFAVTVKKAPRVNIDLFFLYTTKNESYIGGLEWGTRKKYKWSYPRITELCTGDLEGRLFNVPCNTKEVLDMEHGEGEWTVDKPSESFVWHKSNKNVMENGFFSQSDMKGMRAY